MMEEGETGEGFNCDMHHNAPYTASCSAVEGRVRGAVCQRERQRSSFILMCAPVCETYRPCVCVGCGEIGVVRFIHTGPLLHSSI